MPEVEADYLVEDYTFYLSMADIALLDECREHQGNAFSAEELKTVLYKNGLDTKRNYQFVVDQHRTLTGKVAKTSRVLGFMRKDKQWLENFGTDINETIRELACDKKYRGSEDMFKETR